MNGKEEMFTHIMESLMTIQKASMITKVAMEV